MNSAGITGVGAMGMAMAFHLQNRGHHVCGRDVRSAAPAPSQPLLADLVAGRFVVGKTIGDAVEAKRVNNRLTGIHLVAGAEALALATRLGLDPRATATLRDAVPRRVRRCCARCIRWCPRHGRWIAHAVTCRLT
ncbi:MAG: NAD-binding protein [Burkholderiales bacterium]|nr:NAD-binding protein [Burkholderiales bacterium]